MSGLTVVDSVIVTVDVLSAWVLGRWRELLFWGSISMMVGLLALLLRWIRNAVNDRRPEDDDLAIW